MSAPPRQRPLLVPDSPSLPCTWGPQNAASLRSTSWGGLHPSSFIPPFLSWSQSVLWLGSCPLRPVVPWEPNLSYEILSQVPQYLQFTQNEDAQV